MNEVAVLHRCSLCREWKPEADFHRSRRGEFSYCRDCRNAYDRAYYAARGKPARQARMRTAIDAARVWMNSIKDGLPCSDCGEIFPVFVMDWDHLPSFEKIDEISSMLGHRTRQTILEELKKCELVCANCHVVRTAARASAGAHNQSG